MLFIQTLMYLLGTDRHSVFGCTNMVLHKQELSNGWPFATHAMSHGESL